MNYQLSIMVIFLKSAHFQEMYVQAEKTYPEECCGLLLGEIKEDKTWVKEVIPTENSWNDQEFFINYFSQGSKKNRFSIAPEVLLKVQKNARDRGLSIVGIYHSHPDHVAIPSEFDRQIAWTEYSYLIMAVQEKRVTALKGWKLDHNQQFQPEEIREYL